MPPVGRLLVVDDDAGLSAMLRQYLEEHGFDVVLAAHPRDGLEALRASHFDALVLDVMLPEMDGLELLNRIRRDERSDVPILMLTAKGDDTDRIVGLELGADDYLGKPFNPRELLARVRALIRRQRRPPVDSQGRLVFGALEIDLERRRVLVDGRERPLTGHQFDLLAALAESPGRVMSRAALAARIRGGGFEAYDRSIDVHVSRVRAAIEDDPKNPKRIQTVRGAGYRFQAHPD